MDYTQSPVPEETLVDNASEDGWDDKEANEAEESVSNEPGEFKLVKKEQCILPANKDAHTQEGEHKLPEQA